MRTLARLSVVILALLAPGVADARDFRITSFDGTRIQAHFFPAENLGGGRAPTVLIGPGWGGGGSRDPDRQTDVPNGQIGTGPLRRAGYNVLTWDPRGFGASGGEAKWDSPHFEARDVQALIDSLAGFDEARLDRAGDPRVGMAGASYGGGIQWVAAAIDSRIDAIVPNVAWHSLSASFARDALFKTGWNTLLCGVSVAKGIGEGLINPEGVQSGSVDAHFYSACRDGFASGTVSAEDRAWLDERGPGTDWTGQVEAPTLLLHSTVDTLFTPSQAIANWAALDARGVPARMMWYCGGHGTCFTPPGPGRYVETAVLRWFARWLKGESVDTGPDFEWIDQDGAWRSSDGYPLESAGELTASGSGALSLITGDPKTSGSTVAGTPAETGIKIALPAPSASADVVGNPELEIEYSGLGAGGAHVFAQLVDLDRGLVLGGQVTPLPVILDGRTRSLSRSLEGVAYRVTPSSRLELQLIGSTNVYGPQRRSGSLTVPRIAVRVPLGRSRVAVPAPKPCKPKFRPRRVKRRAKGLVRVRPRIRCGGQKLTLPVTLSVAGRTVALQTGKRLLVPVPRRAKRLVARYSYDGRDRRAKIKLRRR